MYSENVIVYLVMTIVLRIIFAWNLITTCYTLHKYEKQTSDIWVLDIYCRYFTLLNNMKIKF